MKINTKKPMAGEKNNLEVAILPRSPWASISYRALKSPALSVSLTQTNSILRSHAETVISHAFEIPCSFSEVPL